MRPVEIHQSWSRKESLVNNSIDNSLYDPAGNNSASQDLEYSTTTPGPQPKVQILSGGKRSTRASLHIQKTFTNQKQAIKETL